MRSARSAYAVLLLPLLLGATGGKKGCACGPKPPPDTGPVEVVVVPTPDDPLTVVSLEPSVAKPGIEIASSLFGGGFQSGVKVKIGATPVPAELKGANALRLKIPGMLEGTYDVVVTNPDGKAATLRRGYVVKAGAEDCRFMRVQFDFDKADPSPTALKPLEALKPCYLGAGEIVIDGHSDERGTTEYNLALGERRADSIARWMVTAGVVPSRMRSVSYGEEKPLSRGHDEKAWAENRRAEIHAND